MIVKCMRDNTTFVPIIKPYPRTGKQMTEMSKDGDRFIECPTCARRYFFHDESGKWESDRDLVIVKE